MRAENSVPSIWIGRPMRFASSFARSMLKPSSPPPGLGIACGAKVASMPVRMGCCANAAPDTTSIKEANRRIIAVPLKKSILSLAVHPVERLVHHLLVPPAVPFLCIRLDARQHVRTLAVLFAESLRAEVSYFPEQTLYIEQLQLALVHR